MMGSINCSSACRSRAPATTCEAQSLECLASLGLPLVPHQLCQSEADALAAFRRFGGAVALRVSLPEAARESVTSFVRLNVHTEEEVALAFADLEVQLRHLRLTHDGIVVTPMKRGRRQLLLAASVDPLFGPALIVGEAGRDTEASERTTCLMGPLDVHMVREALESLGITQLSGGRRGGWSVALDRFCAAAVTLYRFVVANATRITSIRLDPVIVGADGDVAILGACVEQSAGEGSLAAPRVALPAGR